MYFLPYLININCFSQWKNLHLPVVLAAVASVPLNSSSGLQTCDSVVSSYESIPSVHKVSNWGRSKARITRNIFRFRLIKREVVNTLVKKSKVHNPTLIEFKTWSLSLLDGRLVSVLYAGSECGQHDLQRGERTPEILTSTLYCPGDARIS